MLAKDSRILKENEFHPVQLRVFFVMITLYTFYFTCNNNLGVAADRIQQSFDLSNATFGILFTIFTLGFGLGQFFSGYLGDRYRIAKSFHDAAGSEFLSWLIMPAMNSASASPPG